MSRRCKLGRSPGAHSHACNNLYAAGLSILHGCENNCVAVVVVEYHGEIVALTGWCDKTSGLVGVDLAGGGFKKCGETLMSFFACDKWYGD